MRNFLIYSFHNYITNTSLAWEHRSHESRRKTISSRERGSRAKDGLVTQYRKDVLTLNNIIPIHVLNNPNFIYKFSKLPNFLNYFNTTFAVHIGRSHWQHNKSESLSRRKSTLILKLLNRSPMFLLSFLAFLYLYLFKFLPCYPMAPKRNPTKAG